MGQCAEENGQFIQAGEIVIHSVGLRDSEEDNCLPLLPEFQVTGSKPQTGEKCLLDRVADGAEMQPNVIPVTSYIFTIDTNL